MSRFTHPSARLTLLRPLPAGMEGVLDVDTDLTPAADPTPGIDAPPARRARPNAGGVAERAAADAADPAETGAPPANDTNGAHLIDFSAEVRRLAAEADEESDEPLSEERAMRIAVLRTAVQEGSYRPDPDAIARAMVERGDA